MKKVNNLRAIKVKFIPQTNTRPNRIKLTEERFKTKDSIIISPTGDEITQTAIDYCQSKGINIVGKATLNVYDEFIILSDSWGEDFVAINE